MFPSIDFGYDCCGWVIANSKSCVECDENKNIVQIYLDQSVPNIVSAYYIPSAISELTYLQKLTLDGLPSMRGTIPESLYNLNTLTELKLTNMPSLVGQISSSIGNLVNLYDLSIYNCGVTGSIPDVFGNMPGLSTAYLGRNNLTGTLPDSFGQLKNIYGIGVERQLIGGMIPASYSNIHPNNFFIDYTCIDFSTIPFKPIPPVMHTGNTPSTCNTALMTKTSTSTATSGIDATRQQSQPTQQTTSPVMLGNANAPNTSMIAAVITALVVCVGGVILAVMLRWRWQRQRQQQEQQKKPPQPANSASSSAVHSTATLQNLPVGAATLDGQREAAVYYYEPFLVSSGIVDSSPACTSTIISQPSTVTAVVASGSRSVGQKIEDSVVEVKDGEGMEGSSTKPALQIFQDVPDHQDDGLPSYQP